VRVFVVAIAPPWIVMVAPLTAVPAKLLTVPLICPEVDKEMFRVAVVPEVTVAVLLCVPHPFRVAVTRYVPGLSEDSVYVPDESEVAVTPAVVTDAPERGEPLLTLVILPETFPTPPGGVGVGAGVGVGDGLGEGVGVGVATGVGLGVGLGFGVGVGAGAVDTTMFSVCLNTIPELSLACTVKRCAPADAAIEVSRDPPDWVITALPSR
jgi:hypothetical protein